MAVIKNSNIVLSSDIGSVLNAAGGSVNINQPATFFKTEAKINMWSKRKPIPLPTNFCQDFDSSKPDYMAEWWRGKDYNCGITIPSYNQMDDVLSVMDGDKNGWSYTLPSGGILSPFRLGDFVGYDTNANPPFSDFQFPEIISRTSTSATGSFAYNVISSDGTSLNLSNFDKIKDCYMGVKLYNTSTGFGTWNTMDKTISEAGAPEVTLNINGLSTGDTWVAVPFLSTAKQPQFSPLNVAMYYAVPGVSKVKFKVIAADVVITIYANYNYINGVKKSLSVNKIEVTSYLTSTTLTNNWMKIRFAENDYDDPMESDQETGAIEYKVQLNDVTTVKGETVQLNLPMKDQLYSVVNSKSYIIYVTLGSGKYEGKLLPAEEFVPLQ